MFDNYSIKPTSGAGGGYRLVCPKGHVFYSGKKRECPECKRKKDEQKEERQILNVDKELISTWVHTKMPKYKILLAQLESRGWRIFTQGDLLASSLFDFTCPDGHVSAGVTLTNAFRKGSTFSCVGCGEKYVPKDITVTKTLFASLEEGQVKIGYRKYIRENEIIVNKVTLELQPQVSRMISLMLKNREIYISAGEVVVKIFLHKDYDGNTLYLVQGLEYDDYLSREEVGQILIWSANEDDCFFA